MADQVRAHFDGKQVVLDEPAPFAPGEELLVSRWDTTNGAKRSPLQALLAQQGDRVYPTLGEILAEMPEPPADEQDLWSIIEENRKERRRAAAETEEPDYFS